jgi:hypothetical protein
MNPLQAHEEAIRSQVCADCIYPSGSGICGAGHTAECPLNTLLPRAVEAVKNRRSGSILEFFRSLSTGDRNSASRTDTAMTAQEAQWLKDALPLIAAAVEEADARLMRLTARQGKSGT